MRSLVSAVLVSTMFAATVMAEPRSFSLNDPSGQFLVEVLFPDVPQDLQQLAPALITLRDKTSLAILQQFSTPAAGVPLDGDGKTLDWRLVGEDGVVYFADIDRDGRQDLAIRNGDGADAGFQSNYDVYLQDPQQPRWVLNRPLTDLANETSGGMFSVTPKDGIIHSQTDRGCCWTRASRWQMRNGELVRLSAYTQQEVPASDDDDTSMPKGYMLRTTGEWKDGQWHETPRLEGPVNEDPQMLAGTLNGKIPVQLWYQQQGEVLIGEVRYTKSGSGKPIKLVGSMGDYDDKPFVYLHESTEDGHQTGTWQITRASVEPFDYSGAWVSSGKKGASELTVQLHAVDREPEYAKYGDVARDQRSGHYQMRDDYLGRDGDLDLKILPQRDAQGREVAQFSVTLNDTGTGKPIVTTQQRVPMETDNLIIVRAPLAAKGNGPYHIQLVKDFAVIKHNAEPDFPDYLTGMYRRQP